LLVISLRFKSQLFVCSLFTAAQRSVAWIMDCVNHKRGIPRSMNRKWKMTALPPRSPDLMPLNFFVWELVKDPVQPRVDMLNQCFPNVSDRGPLLASKNNHGSSHSCSRQCRVSELCFPLPRRYSLRAVQGLLVIGGSTSHQNTPHLVGLLWTSDQPDAEAST
jgi:hypothetical protein